MKQKNKSFPISNALIVVIAFSYQSVNTQNLFHSENESISIYISPLDSTMYSNSVFSLNKSNYYVQIELGFSNKLKLIPTQENLLGIKENSNLNLGNILEVDVFSPHRHTPQELSVYEKFIIKCLLLLRFRFSSDDPN